MEWSGVSETERETEKGKQKEIEETMKSNQLQDEEQSYFRKANRQLKIANNGMLESCEIDHHGEHARSGSPDETTRMIKKELQEGTLSDERNEEKR